MEDVYCDNLRIVGVKSRTKTQSMPYYCAYDMDLERIYITDYDNDQVLVYCALSGAYLVRFGKRGKKTLNFNKPTGIAYSSHKKLLFVVDCWNHRIHLIKTPKPKRKSTSPSKSPPKTISRNDSSLKDYKHHSFIGDTHTDSTHPYYLSYPGGVSVDDVLERIYVTDRNGEKIVVFSYEGEPIGLITSGIRMPTGIAYDSVCERLYICDQSSNYIKVLTKDGRYVDTTENEYNKGTVLPGHPYGIALVRFENIKALVVSEMNENRIRVCLCNDSSFPSSSNSPGKEEISFIFTLGNEGSEDLEFVFPRGICSIGNGCVCVCDTENSRIHFIDIKKVIKTTSIPKLPVPTLDLPSSSGDSGRFHKTRIPSAHIARLTHLSSSIATPRTQSPRVTMDRLLTSAKKSRDLRHLCDVATFICTLHKDRDMSVLSILDYVNVDSFFPSMTSTTQEYIDSSIEKKRKVIVRKVEEWSWDKFTKEETIHLVKFIVSLQYVSDLNWLLSNVIPKVVNVCNRNKPENLILSDESAIGYNATTKAIYRTGRCDSGLVFIKTIILENESWWHRELYHNRVLCNMDCEYVIKLKDWYFDYDFQACRWNLCFVYDYIPCNYAEVLATWVRSLMSNKESVPKWEDRLKICICIAKGIRFLHTVLYTVHRDIKLQNILCDNQGIPLICDLGLAETQELYYTRHVCEGPYDDLAPELTCMNSTRLQDSKNRNSLTINPYMIDVYNFGGILFLIMSITHHKELSLIDKWKPENERDTEIQNIINLCRMTNPEERMTIVNCVDRLEHMLDI